MQQLGGQSTGSHPGRQGGVWKECLLRRDRALCLHCLPSLRTLCLRAKNTHLEGNTGAVQPKGVTSVSFYPRLALWPGPQGGAVEKKLHKWKKMTVAKAGMCYGDQSLSLSPLEMAYIGPSHCDPEQLLVA